MIPDFIMASKSGVFEGKEGWFFHGSGTTNWIDYFLGRTVLPDRILDGWKTHLKGAHQHSLKIGSKFLCACVPEKHTVLSSCLPTSFSGTRGRILERFSEMLIDFDYFLDLEKESVFSDLNEPFLKRDSHWSPEGALASGARLVEKLGLEPIAKSPSNLQYDPPMDYFSSWFECRKKVESLLLPSSASRKTQQLASNIGSLIYLKNPKVLQKRTLCIFGNSFCEYYLVNSLANRFSEIFFIFSPFYDEAAAESIRPDYSIFLTNERFLVLEPNQMSKNSLLTRLCIDREASRSEIDETVLSAFGGAYEIYSLLRNGNERDFLEGIAFSVERSSRLERDLFTCAYAFDFFSGSNWFEKMRKVLGEPSDPIFEAFQNSYLEYQTKQSLVSVRES